MKKIRFIADTDKRRHGASYKIGDAPTLVDSSANRWIRRGVAVEVVPGRPGLRLDRPMMAAEPKAKASSEPEPKKSETEAAEGTPSPKPASSSDDGVSDPDAKSEAAPAETAPQPPAPGASTSKQAGRKPRGRPKSK